MTNKFDWNLSFGALCGIVGVAGMINSLNKGDVAVFIVSAILVAISIPILKERL